MADVINASELSEGMTRGNSGYKRAGKVCVHEPHSLQGGLLLTIPQGGEPVVAVDASKASHLIAKRVLDILVSTAAILMLLPLMVMVSVAIKLTSPGPVLFRQTREGLDGRPFLALKFRSMRNDSCDVSGVQQTLKGDHRVTAVGRFIRRTSIDELPQLINILRGEMSLVGPRPHVKGMLAAGVPYRDLVPYYDFRLAVAPGLTGWAQANGLRGSTIQADLARARIDHDIAYIQNFSIWLDIKIIVMTIWREFLGGSGH